MKGKMETGERDSDKLKHQAEAISTTLILTVHTSNGGPTCHNISDKERATSKGVNGPWTTRKYFIGESRASQFLSKGLFDKSWPFMDIIL